MNKQYQILLERLLFSSDDLVYNMDQWLNSSDGKLFITGYTGSGKSTLASKFSKKYNVKHIELDDYIPVDVNKVKRLRSENKFKELQLYFDKISNKAINDLLNSKDKLIIEGIQIFLFNDLNKFKEHSIIITGTSALKSFYRAVKRNLNSDWSEKYSFFEVVDDVYYNLFIKKVEYFIKLVKKWKNE